MTEAESDYDRLRRAERELDLHRPEVVEPVEETQAAADAVEDEAPMRDVSEREGRAA